MASGVWRRAGKWVRVVSASYEYRRGESVQSTKRRRHKQSKTSRTRCDSYEGSGGEEGSVLRTPLPGRLRGRSIVHRRSIWVLWFLVYGRLRQRRRHGRRRVARPAWAGGLRHRRGRHARVDSVRRGCGAVDRRGGRRCRRATAIVERGDDVCAVAAST